MLWQSLSLSLSLSLSFSSNVVLGNLEPVCSGSLAMSVVRNNIKVNVSLRGRLWRLN